MKSNILAFFFTIGSIVMAAFIVWFYNMSDRVQPEMRFSAYELTYSADTAESDLLNGVTAYDAVDGDITDRIVVEKTILNEKQDTAVVYYAVSDLSGNVTKQSRVFPADIESIRNSGTDVFSTDESYVEYPSGFAGEGFNTDGFVTDEASEGGFQTENSEGGFQTMTADVEGGSQEGAEAGETAGN